MEYMIAFDTERCIACHACENACKSWGEHADSGLSMRKVKKVWLLAGQGEPGAPDAAGELAAGQTQGAALSFAPFCDNSIKLKTLALACLHCVDAACMAACPVKALYRDAVSARVLLDGAKCTGCLLCRKACPYGVPQRSTNKKMLKCNLCLNSTAESNSVEVNIANTQPPCVSTCPSGALRLEPCTVAKKQAQEAAILQLLNISGQ